MKRRLSQSISAGKDTKARIEHILNPQVNELIAYTGIAQASRSFYGYGVSFDDNTLEDISGCVETDKSGYRSELRAIYWALYKVACVAQQQTAVQTYTIYSCHDYAVSRINGGHEVRRGSRGARWAQGGTKSSTTRTTTNSEVNHTPCLDFLLQIRLLLEYISSRGNIARVIYTKDTVSGVARATKLARGAIATPVTSEDQRDEVLGGLPSLSIYAGTESPDEPQQVYTDGSSIQLDDSTRAGYGVFFGVCDPRNETGSVRGSGTGPRGALAGILRAIYQISQSHRGQKVWEVVSCRAQYIDAIFNLSADWQASGWRRSAGKPIASLDIYRAARKLLDELKEQGFSIKGKYVTDKQKHLGLVAADIMARKGAGDLGIELPRTCSKNNVMSIDSSERTVWAEVHYYPSNEPPGYRTQWILRFQPLERGTLKVEQGTIFGYRDALSNSLLSISKALKFIENESERQWRVGTSNKEAVELLNNPKNVIEDKKKRALVEPIVSTHKRLQRHGYEIVYFFEAEIKEERV